jgi:gas vesicle protein
VAALDHLPQTVRAGDAIVTVYVVIAFAVGGAIGAAIAWLAARAETAGLRATLAASSDTQRQAVEALIERAKNDLRDATAERAGERVGAFVEPVAQKLQQIDRLMSDLEAKRQHDAGKLHAHISPRKPRRW